jgi:hypothetical protein
MSTLWSRRFAFVILGGIALLHLSCEQYDYTSPYPGILEIRLHAANSRSLLRFDPGNSFIMTLRSLDAVETPPVKLPIYSDLAAIRRNPDGDSYNCLHPEARDSAFTLGRVYSPPTTYRQLYLTVEVSGIVFVTDPISGVPNILQVHQDPTIESFRQLPAPGQPPLTIPVETDHRTVVTVTFDLDSSLVRRTEWFDYRPYFYVSSVNVY